LLSAHRIAQRLGSTAQLYRRDADAVCRAIKPASGGAYHALSGPLDLAKVVERIE
jgi:hypothetical protein